VLRAKLWICVKLYFTVVKLYFTVLAYCTKAWAQTPTQMNLVECILNNTIQYNAVLSYTPHVAYSQTIRRRQHWQHCISVMERLKKFVLSLNCLHIPYSLFFDVFTYNTFFNNFYYFLNFYLQYDIILYDLLLYYYCIFYLLSLWRMLLLEQLSLPFYSCQAVWPLYCDDLLLYCLAKKNLIKQFYCSFIERANNICARGPWLSHPVPTAIHTPDLLTM